MTALANPDEVLTAALPAWMWQRIVTSLLAVAVELGQLEHATVYISPNERRGFADELDGLAKIGRAINEQIKRQRAGGLAGTSAAGGP
jgi:hypothetical protein